jgi:hypothetical protein
MCMDRKTQVIMCKTDPLTSEDRPAPQGYKTCPICGRHIKAQGFGGHMWGVHGIKVGRKAELADLQQRLDRYEAWLPNVRLMDGSHIGLPSYDVLVIPKAQLEQAKK